MKKIYKFMHDGKEFSRRTECTYTHAVVVKGNRIQDGEYFHSCSYVGRCDLVQAAIKQAEKLFLPCDIHVVELIQP